MILEEGHRCSLVFTPNLPMYQNLRTVFWWPKMKKEIVEFLHAYVTSQNSKIEYQIIGNVITIKDTCMEVGNHNY